MNIRKILVPTDFSECAQHAVDEAVELAQKFDAELLLTHVMEAPIYPAVTFAGAANVPAVHEEIAQACEEQLKKQVAGMPEGVKARSVRRDGRPFQEIAELAKEENVDLVVIATHGYTGLTHFMLGSTAERVVRAAPCPVLTVRGKD